MGKISVVDANKLANNTKVDIEITGLSKFRIRSVIGGLFVKFGLLIIGVNVELKFKE